MRILFVTASNPFDPTSGSRQRSAHLLNALRQLGEVDILDPIALGEGSWIRKIFAIPFRKITKVCRWPSRKLPDIPKGKYDLVVARYLWAAAEIEAWRLGPCYVDLDDIPIKTFQNVDSRRLPVYLRPVGRILVEVWQRYCLNKCKGAWVVNAEELPYIQKLINGRVGLLPNIARGPSANYKVNGQQDLILMTVGYMGYAPNGEGIDWFLDNVWMEVYRAYPEMTYCIAGGGAAVDKVNKWGQYPGVKVLGFVDDLDDLYAKSIAVVAPILSGAGTCIKVVEAAIHGRKVFVTKVAIRGNEDLTGAEVFGSKSEFLDKFGQWLASPVQQRKKEQERIYEYASTRNSYSRFAESVNDILLHE